MQPSKSHLEPKSATPTPSTNPPRLTERPSAVFDTLPSSHVVRGLAPATFLFYRAGADLEADAPLTQHDDYVRFEYQRQALRAPTVEKVLAASARELLRDVGGLGEWNSLRREGGGVGGGCQLVDVYIVREQETPKRVYIDRFYDPKDPDRANARLADWIEWGVAVGDPKRFRFEVLLEFKAREKRR